MPGELSGTTVGGKCVFPRTSRAADDRIERSMMGEVIRVSGRAADVGDFLKEAMLSQRFADVALCCPGGQRFLAHRLVLSAASPYLQVGISE